MSQKLPFIDLATQYRQNQANIDQAIRQVLEHGQYIMGSEVSDLEVALADYCGARHVIACSSGTDALVLPLMAKDLNPNDAIFTSPFTFFASAEAISLAGATPVFVDIDADTYNLNPQDLQNKIDAINKQGKLRPRGVIAVDLFGITADYNEINRIAKAHDLFVIEDAAQSFGADYHDQRAGALAEIAATSFYPAKPLGAYGDGGAVFTSDSELYDTLLSLRVHGQAKSGNKYDNVRIGLNARMDTLQAAILLEKLAIFDNERIARNKVAARYSELLSDVVKTPTVPAGQSSVWAQYSIEVENRDEVRAALDAQGIPTAVFYPIPVHLSSAYKHLGYKTGDFPISEAVSKKILSLPMHPYLEAADIKRICEIILKSAQA